MTMLKVNIFEAKAKLSKLVARVQDGETVVICKRNQPVAELRPVSAKRVVPRVLGQGADLVDIPASFFDPLPADVLEAFESPVEPALPGLLPSRVAERPFRPSRGAGRSPGRNR